MQLDGDTDPLIEDLLVSKAIKSTLLKAGFKRLSDIRDYSVEELSRIRQLGINSIRELKEALKDYYNISIIEESNASVKLNKKTEIGKEICL
ncbi:MULTISPECIES: DNA-directed RNA polymerase subunit alpha C-terminal domain-containing protein [unclassified Paenibacillus]|uniref:DNA-directed RNA polymerase subunit alpha C-terminal domain-containing protein n=1 Tax=unclassified Paenibacillus TaxID=185978 RepID=UPI00070B51D6|nr:MULTISPECIES: DNA-directed RNA polymerase subunit alpha C-terminal domain-containing protein [unclassified Paenibacillus]KQX45950.1 hypothetical protein ASD40_19170 [Paenibacillus sp. Root444D2]KRE50867.1 hypothetical protein ASG85_20165 [Paenibacillus sp. Soil724D2]